MTAGDWVLFDDTGFPFAFGNADYVTRDEMLEDRRTRARVARIELVTDETERRRLLDIHANGHP